ncbi:protein of unknown function [Azospirillum baldaniorum]|uniref:Uncharacterized protein n=1 Tax=Azospirillum baldaniorum TaxID=1064539 RepID=A0A9P1NMJ3_9PROT|nr:protein of unknown function [Azospirillum baldaniorum]
MPVRWTNAARRKVLHRQPTSTFVLIRLSECARTVGAPYNV